MYLSLEKIRIQTHMCTHRQSFHSPSKGLDEARLARACKAMQQITPPERDAPISVPPLRGQKLTAVAQYVLCLRAARQARQPCIAKPLVLGRGTR